MRRKLLVINLILTALVAGAALRLRRQWIEGQERTRQLFRSAAQPPASPAAVSFAPLQPLTAASYLAAAEKLLFAKDRNPTVVIEPAPPKVIPPLPVLHGLVNFGDGPLVILSEKPGGPHKAYAVGEKVGDFTLVSVGDSQIVFEWEGERIRRRLEELVERRAQEPAPASEGIPAPAPVQAPQTTVVTPSEAEGFGPSLGNEMRACLPGDTSPPGTVRAGMRKVVTPTPFGQVCRWEPVQ
ncbi:MAG: hypothetical protein RMK57_07855 [Bryobacterales bacterium]|nr:hypothetical protein [Bryobacteraceae bacterium]MDW8354430.1 hypothetical protein [Bryobacterales bacterium]